MMKKLSLLFVLCFAQAAQSFDAADVNNGYVGGLPVKSNAPRAGKHFFIGLLIGLDHGAINEAVKDAHEQEARRTGQRPNQHNNQNKVSNEAFEKAVTFWLQKV